MKIGILCLPLAGHLHPLAALARKLQARGHEVVLFGLLDNAADFSTGDFQFVSYAEEECPLGFVAQTWAPIARMYGMEIIRYALTDINPKLLEVIFSRLPARVRANGIEAMVIDAALGFSELVPMALGIPFVQVWSILHPDFSAVTPLCTTTRPDERTPQALERNARDLQELGKLLAASIPVAASFAEKHNLHIDWQQPGATSSKLAIITQTPSAFDFPELPWQGQFRYAGPFIDDVARAPIPFDWQLLDGRALIYASLGTLTNGLLHIHQAIVAAAATMPQVQVVFSVGHTVEATALGPLPANVFIVPAAPQLALLKRASLCVTHAGLNTVLEALSEGVPLVALPIGYDQPGVASRIVYHGVGEFMEVTDLASGNLRELIQQVLDTPSYLNQAKRFQRLLRDLPGLDIAAEIIEEAFSGSAPSQES